MNKNIFKKYSTRTILSIIATLVLLLTSDLNRSDFKILKSNKEVLPQVNIQSESLTLVKMPDDKIQTVLSLIDNAQKNVDLVIYDLKDKKVGDALVSAHKRGVAVRVLLNKGYYGKQEPRNESSYDYLLSKGISVKWAPSYFALTHQKTLVADNKALIMTFNLVPKYYSSSRDFGILTTNTNDVDAIKRTFDADFNGEKIEEQNGDSLLWSPGAEEEILTIINRSEKSLEIYSQLMDYQKVTDALVAKAKEGVDVKVIITYASNWRSALAQLRNAGVHVRTYEGKKAIYIHTKVIISDGNYMYLGSQNFSSNSLNKNRELGIFVTDSKIISEIQSVFSKDWSGGKDF